MSEDRLLTIEEISETLQIHKISIYRWIAGRGQDGIPHIRVGKKLRFEKEKVLEFFKNQTNKDKT